MTLKTQFLCRCVVIFAGYLISVGLYTALYPKPWLIHNAWCICAGTKDQLGLVHFTDRALATTTEPTQRQMHSID